MEAAAVAAWKMTIITIKAIIERELGKFFVHRRQNAVVVRIVEEVGEF